MQNDVDPFLSAITNAVDAFNGAKVEEKGDTVAQRHRSDWCEFVYKASVGRSMQEVADLLSKDRSWVQDQLDIYGVESAQGGGLAQLSLTATTEEILAAVRDYAPEEPGEEYVCEYEAKGYTPEVARRLAIAYEAGENALDAGVLEEASGPAP